MLEHNFGELDDDFVTLWSRYILTNDESFISGELEKLAELGQINAVQAYYMLVAQAGIVRTNSVIGDRVDENKFSRNFNQILAEAYRTYAEVGRKYAIQDMLNTLSDQLDELDKINAEYNRNLGHGGALCVSSADLGELQEQYDALDAKRNETIEMIKSEKCVEKEIFALRSCLALYEKTKNPFVMERYLEMLDNTIAPLVFNIDERRFNHRLAHTRKELLKLHKTNPNAQTDFALAKNMIFFGKKDKNKKMGRDILAKLAERPLSKTLTDYQLQGEETLPKTRQSGDFHFSAI